jgi:hypothetical protein
MEKQDTVSTVNEVAVALANEQQKAWEAKVKEQDKAIAKIADVIGLDERSKPFQIIERIRILMAYADVKASEGDGRSFIGDTIKSLMVKGNGCVIFKYADSNVCTVNNNGIHCRIGDEEERMHNFLAHVLRLGITEGMRRGNDALNEARDHANRLADQVADADKRAALFKEEAQEQRRRVFDKDSFSKFVNDYMERIEDTVGLPKGSDLASVARRVGEVQARAKELEAAVKEARKQGFDEAKAIVDKIVEDQRKAVEKANLDHERAKKDLAEAEQTVASCAGLWVWLQHESSAVSFVANELNDAVLCDDE